MNFLSSFKYSIITNIQIKILDIINFFVIQIKKLFLVNDKTSKLTLINLIYILSNLFYCQTLENKKILKFYSYLNNFLLIMINGIHLVINLFYECNHQMVYAWRRILPKLNTLQNLSNK